MWEEKEPIIALMQKLVLSQIQKWEQILSRVLSREPNSRESNKYTAKAAH